MKEKSFFKSQSLRHGEIISRLDRIIAILTIENKVATKVEEAVVAAAKEYYTNADMLAILRVTKRTLARYRQLKLVRYYMIGRKVYYKVSEVQEFLQKKGKGALEDSAFAGK